MFPTVTHSIDITICRSKRSRSESDLNPRKVSLLGDYKLKYLIDFLKHLNVKLSLRILVSAKGFDWVEYFKEYPDAICAQVKWFQHVS